MSRPKSIAIIDDDPAFTSLQKFFVEERFPDVKVVVSHEPTFMPGKDIYLVDNRFGEDEKAGELITQIRDNQPDALIILWSGHVSKELLKDVSRVGIDAVAEKGNQEDIDAALEVIARHLDKQETKPSLRSTVGTIRDLLSEWNTRLEREEAKA